MGIAFLQTAALGSTTNGASQQTSAFAANPTVGNYIVAWAWGFNTSANSTAPTLSDTGGNSYTIPTGCFQFRSADVWCLAAYTKVATTGAAFKLTVTKPAAWVICPFMIVASEFSGVAGASPLDGTPAGTTGTTGAPAPGSMAVSSGSLVAATMANDAAGTATVTTPGGWSSVGKQTSGSFEVGDAAYQVGPASPTNPTWNSGTVAWAASQFALLAASTPAVFIPGPFPGIATAILAV